MRFLLTIMRLGNEDDAVAVAVARCLAGHRMWQQREATAADSKH